MDEKRRILKLVLPTHVLGANYAWTNSSNAASVSRCVVFVVFFGLLLMVILLFLILFYCAGAILLQSVPGERLARQTQV